MKKLFGLILILLIFVSFNLFVVSDPVSSAAKSKGLDEEQVKQLEQNVDALVKKVYASGLFSPQDAEMLVDIKTKLDSVIGTNTKDPMYARLFFNTGYILKEREYVDEAIQYFNLVGEKFPETPYAKRAESELKKLGVKSEGEAEAEGEEPEEEKEE
ncbi:MAG: hypothetical protein A2Y25_01135 [Candidatus Melainabacteria bacterium GWF2_37_15]|nr:MAG: hypothetical protein A2Y25_01135 [Candidatus Melainabacteria bacterium GWF2_37_15]